MEELLDNMKSLFDGLEPASALQAMPLEHVLDISMETGNSVTSHMEDRNIAV